MRGKELFLADSNEVLRQYPTLKMYIVDDTPVLNGEIQLSDKDGIIYDSYSVSIKPTLYYPYLFPCVFETGGRLPVNSDWHVYESTGNCCIKAKPEELIICSKGIGLKEFIKEQVEPYLSNQTFRRQNGFYLKERPHGIKGTIESFKELFKTDNILKVVTNLEFILKQIEPGRTHLCFCGSGIKYRKCHRTTYRGISQSELGLPCFNLMLMEIKKTIEFRIQARGVEISH